MFWPFKKKAKDPYDPVIAKQIDDQWGNFNQLVHEKVGHLEEEYVRWRKRSKIAGIAIVVGVILIAGDEGGSTVELLGYLFGFSGSGMLITFLLGLLLVGVSVWVLWRWSKIKKEFNKVFNPIVFDKAFAVLGFEGRHLSKETVSQQDIVSILDKSELITESRNRYRIDDMVDSEFQDRSLFVAELNVRHVTGSGKNRRTKKVFHGILIEHDLPRTLSGKTFITTEGDKRGFGKRSWWRSWFKTKEVPQETVLEWNDFENKLHVATTDATEARYILTPDFMATLYDWWKVRKGKIRVSFIEDKLYVLYPDDRIKIGSTTVSLQEKDVKKYVLEVARPLWHVKKLMESAEARFRWW